MSEQSAFSAAVLAIDQGQTEALEALLARHPELARARGPGDELPYFRGSTLLHYVAWNPFPRDRALGLDTEAAADMPATMPEIVRLLVEAGADPRAVNDGGSDAVALLLTGCLASEAELCEPLLAALERAGARVECSAEAVHRALANHSPRGARALLARGAPWDVHSAAGLGELARVQALVREQTPGREVLGRAALQAYVSEQPETFEWLLTTELDLDATGVGNGTLLHRACAAGDLPLVERLIELGADVDNRDNPFVATPLDWADHGGKPEIVTWVLTRAADRVDIFQAAAYGLRERAEALLDADAEVVHACRRIWRIPAVQPLRIAVIKGRVELASLLVERGAAVDHVAGDGRTAIEQARVDGHAALIELLERA